MKYNTLSPNNVLISGTHSGAGKTIVSFAIMSLLQKLGFTVQPFKIGPDFIDTGYHKLATGCDSINLDFWMMGIKGIKISFKKFSSKANISIIEGMGGLFDGNNSTDRGSSGYLAKQLNLPVILVVDIAGSTRGVAALLAGYMKFDPKVKIAGVIFNRAGSEKHYEMVLKALPLKLRKLVLGYVPISKICEVPERHLGLLTIEENENAIKIKDGIVDIVEGTLNIERLLKILDLKIGCCPTINQKEEEVKAKTKKKIRLGIAKDSAFCFYYSENLQMLEEAGAELVPFSPINDLHLPKLLDGLYLGGGYPEAFAESLSNNIIRQEILEFSNLGMPIYAECGGLIYLCRTLINFDGVHYPMASIFPIDIIMDKNFLAIKYASIQTTQETLLGPINTQAKGQEFHQSRFVSQPELESCYVATTNMNETYFEGFKKNNVFASYLHIHFRSSPRIPISFISKCLSYKINKQFLATA